MVVAIANSEETEQWQKEDGKYIPYPAKWLNEKRWEDEPKITREKEPQWPEL
jgi:hypothetical protein